MAFFGNGLAFLNSVFTQEIGSSIYEETTVYNIIIFFEGLPFVLKPFWALVSDIHAPFGFRFKSLIIGFTIFQTSCCLLLFLIDKPSFAMYLILNSIISLSTAVNSVLVQGIITMVTKIDAKVRYPEFKKNSGLYESKSNRFIGCYQGILLTSKFLLTI